MAVTFKGWVTFSLKLVLITLSMIVVLSQSVMAADPAPYIFLNSVPQVVEPGEVFQIQIEMGTTGGPGYGTDGAHVNIDSGTIVSCLETETGFPSCVTGVDSVYGQGYSEFYHSGYWPPSTIVFGYLTLQAPESGAMNIEYRAWMRDSYTCPGSGQGRLYRDPPDYSVGQGTCNEKYFMDYTTYTKTVVVAAPLDDDSPISVNLNTGPRKFSFHVSKWAIAGIRLTDGDDHDIKVDDDPKFGSYTSSTKWDTTPDFVVVNGHNTWGGYYAEVYHSTGSGHSATIEAEGDSTTTLAVGTGRSDTISTDEVNEMYQVYLDSSTTYAITLDVTSGSADLDIFVYDPSTNIDKRNGADASSTSGGSGQDEEISGYSPSTTGYAGIAVIHDGTGSDSASYTLSVTENNNPTASGNSFSPGSGDTNTYFDFYMTYTDIDNDPPSSDYPKIQFGEGAWRSMDKNSFDDDYTDGVLYDYTTKLSAGSHTYRFKYKDDYSGELYYPESGTFTGPSVSSAPDPCEGIVPSMILSEDNPSVTSNYKLEGLSLTKLLKEITGTISSIDVNITAKVTYPSCVSRVESRLDKYRFILNNLELYSIEYFQLNEEESGIYVGRWKWPSEPPQVVIDRIVEWVIKFSSGSVLIDFPPPYVNYTETLLTDVSGSVIKIDHPDKYLPSEWYPKHGKFDFVIVKANSPVDITVIDPTDNRVGAFYQDGVLVNETNDIPNRAFYSGNDTKPEIVVIENPTTGEYKVAVRGTEEGTYDMNLTVIVNNEITLNQTLDDVPIQKGEVQEISFKVEGGSAYLLAHTHSTSYQQGDTLTSTIYVENTGGIIINEFLAIAIKDPTGEVIHKEKELLYLEGGESQFVRFNWQVPIDAENGYYWLKAEFEPPYIDVLQSINSFWIG